jgi:GABA(A) receptor-associated protein
MPIFKHEFNFSQRKEESLRVLTKYPERVPIICEKSNQRNLPDLDKKKYLVPRDLTVGQFGYVIRRRMNLKQEESLFIFINNETIASTSDTIGNLYNKYKDIDGFVYVNYSKENVFG